MAAKITSLTPEQEARFPEFVKKWLAIGLSTAPADRKAAEFGVQRAYESAGLKPPGIMIWLDSPLRGCIGAALLQDVYAHLRDQVYDRVRVQVGAQVGDQVRDQVGVQVRDQVGDQVGVQVRDQVGDQVRDQVYVQVRDQVRAQVGDQVGDQVYAQVGDQVYAQVSAQVGVQVGDQVCAQVRAQVGDQVGVQVGVQVRAQVSDQVRAQVRAQVSTAIWGQHEAGWLSFYDFFSEILDRSTIKPLDELMLVAQSCGWWWPFRDAVILTERPVTLHRDALHRLHCPDGPAIVYPDGWGVYAWHGVRVPSWVITEPEKITVQAITSTPNQEIKRVMLERFGFDRYLDEAGAKLLHQDECGELFRASLGARDPLLLVRVVNSSPEPDGSFRRYCLAVHPELRPLLGDGQLGPRQKLTARNAVASTWGLTGEQYQPSIQT